MGLIPYTHSYRVKDRSVTVSLDGDVTAHVGDAPEPSKLV